MNIILSFVNIITYLNIKLKNIHLYDLATFKKW